MAPISSLQLIGVPVSARTLAAASRAESFLGVAVAVCGSAAFGWRWRLGMAKPPSRVAFSGWADFSGVGPGWSAGSASRNAIGLLASSARFQVTSYPPRT